jgi:type I restriction enzyme M protein
MTNNEVEKRLWEAADQLRANSKLKASEYSLPVLGLIFLRYADSRFTAIRKLLQAERANAAGVAPADPAAPAPVEAPLPRGQVVLDFDKLEYQARGVLYVPEAARFSNLLKLPEGADVAGAISDAMKAIEAENEDLKDVLPKTYNRLDTATLVELLRLLARSTNTSWVNSP